MYRLSARFSDTYGLNFFLVYKFISPNVYKPVYKSEIMASQNGVFVWKQASILSSELCNEEPEREIRIEFFKSQKSGLNKNIGHIALTLAALKEGTLDFTLQKNNKFTSESVKFELCEFKERHTFLQYVFGGCQIQLAVSIDFTLSNGNP